MSEASWIMRTVVELDLVGYSTVARQLEEAMSVKAVADFNQQIQGFVDVGLEAAGVTRESSVRATTGDGAILLFDGAEAAHRFAVAVHQATVKHNLGRATSSAKRWFRIGAATGKLAALSSDGTPTTAGIVIANAVRLEAAGRPGEILVDVPTYDGLSAESKLLYGTPEIVHGKREERFPARRYAVVVEESSSPETPNPSSSSTVASVFRIKESRPRASFAA